VKYIAAATEQRASRIAGVGSLDAHAVKGIPAIRTEVKRVGARPWWNARPVIRTWWQNSGRQPVTM
jgi:hypothetical protein